MNYQKVFAVIVLAQAFLAVFTVGLITHSGARSQSQNAVEIQDGDCFSDRGGMVEREGIMYCTAHCITKERLVCHNWVIEGDIATCIEFEIFTRLYCNGEINGECVMSPAEPSGDIWE